MNGKRKRNGKANKEALAAATMAVAPGELGPDGTIVDATVVGGEMVQLSKPKRERRSGGKVSRWTQEEEERLKALVHELGSSGQWQAIAERLETGRTAAGVDQHYQLMTGRRKRYSAAEKAAAGEAGAEAAAAAAHMVAASMEARPPPTPLQSTPQVQ